VPPPTQSPTAVLDCTDGSFTGISGYAALLCNAALASPPGLLDLCGDIRWILVVRRQLQAESTALAAELEVVPVNCPLTIVSDSLPVQVLVATTKGCPPPCPVIKQGCCLFLFSQPEVVSKRHEYVKGGERLFFLKSDSVKSDNHYICQ
jgi:hypothetical protein